MKKYIKQFGILLILGLSIFLVKQFCREVTGGFRITKICSNLTFSPEWETSPLSEEEAREVDLILDQEFTYLNKGAQCYAFVSQDGKYVLKFFKIPYVPPSFVKEISLPSFLHTWLDEKTWKKQSILQQEFTSYKIAYEKLKRETGLVYIHLNKTDTFHKKITIVDRLNIKHSLDLDKMEFLIQKKGTLAYPHLDALLKENKVEEAKECLRNLFKLIKTRAEKGILDTDPNLSKNFAFIGNTPIQIDNGRFFLISHEEMAKIPEQERARYVNRMTLIFRTWLKDDHGQLVEVFDEELQNLIQSGLF
ncbi:MAG: hypothetical protein HKM07_00145 [Chlamydiae bacterium]|nr:hypothetical protein [Chlamydiota bacterium]